MFRPFKGKRWLKSKKPVNEVPQASASHAQSSTSRSGLPLQPTVLDETGSGNPHNAVPVVAQQGSSTSEAVPGESKRSRDLWEEAFKKLDKDKRDLLSKIEKPQGPKLVEQVVEQAEKSYREHEERGWKVSRGKGKPDINFRAALKKTLLSVLKFKELISAGIAFDPTGHSSAAWTIVSLGLRMTKNDAYLRKNVVDTCETLAATLTLTAAIEANYRDLSLDDLKYLEDTIIVVYVAIFDLSAEIIRENSLNIGQRILESFTTLAEQPLNDFNKILQSKKTTLLDWTRLIEHKYRVQEKKELEEQVLSMLAGIEELTQQVSKVATKMLTAEEHSILDWLSSYSFSESHVAAASRREFKTGTWIFDLPAYEKWKTSDVSILWLYGSCN